MISRRIDESLGLVLGSAVYYGDITRNVDNLLNNSYLRWPPLWIMIIPILIAGMLTFIPAFRHVRYTWIFYALLGLGFADSPSGRVGR
jgi:hypothetical protein